MSLSRPVFNLKAIEFGAFFAYFHLFRHLKVIQIFQKYAKTLYFPKAFRQKNRLKIALQVSKLGFSLIVMRGQPPYRGLIAEKCISPLSEEMFS